MLFAKDINESAGSKYLPVGIHSNCDVIDIVLGEGYIDFIYEKEGQKANNRKYYPKINEIKEKEGKTIQELYLERVHEVLAHVKKHMKIFLEEEEVNNFSAPEIESFCYKAVNLMKPKLKTKKVNLKLIYDKDGQWARFGNFPDYIEEFIEGEPVKLQYTSWEKDNRITRKPAKEVEDTDTSVLY